MYLQRQIDNELLNWKDESRRKPLILRGARQVGKSSTVKNFAKHFDYFIELNFDETPELNNLFEKGQSVDELCESLSVYSQTPIIAGKTLLFFDEIQASIPAISMLRYFYEKRPEIHVIAAGSLLEFALAEIPSFGVGRVRSMFLYPFSFNEFLKALNEEGLSKLIKKANNSHPLNEVLHQKAINYLKKYMIIGGMPEAVSVYIETRDLLKVQNVLNDLIISLQDDFVKYKSSVSKDSITEVFYAVFKQIGNKFSYSYPNSTLNNSQVKVALDLLQKAGLIIPVTHSAANGIPLGSEINTKKRKFLLFDSGILQRILGLDIARLFLDEDIEIVNKGSIAELFVGLELIKNQSCYIKPELYYWQREARNSQAEIDYLIQQQEFIIPIEVKAGTKGAMQSMYIFLEEKKSDIGFRFSLENFSEYGKIKVFPMYAVSNIFKQEKQLQ